MMTHRSQQKYYIIIPYVGIRIRVGYAYRPSQNSMAHGHRTQFLLAHLCVLSLILIDQQDITLGISKGQAVKGKPETRGDVKL